MNPKRIVGNAAWMIGGRVVQSLLGVVVTLLTARYLGPANYGLINYASSVVAFVAPIGKLGLDSILVNELISHPKREGETLGSAMVMSLASGFLCMLGLAGFVSVVNRGEQITLVVCVLYSLVLLAYAAEMTQFWFQAHLLSQYTSLAILAAYVVKSAYQITLLVRGSSIHWFALTNALDIFLIDGILLLLYRKKGGQKLRFSGKAAKRMLAQSRYYIVSSMMVTIFANTDRIMIRMMLGDAQTGYYSAAVACASLTGFVFTAIIYSARPVILEKFRQRDEQYRSVLTLLYAAVIYLSLAQCVVITGFAPFIIRVLYGGEYRLAASPLRLIVWYTTFSYLGSVRNIWIIANEKHNLLWKINLTGALGNILLNLVFIPVMGILGAALASLLTQVITNVLLCYIFKELRPTIAYMRDGLRIRKCIRMLKQLK